MAKSFSLPPNPDCLQATTKRERINIAKVRFCPLAYVRYFEGQCRVLMGEFYAAQDKTKISGIRPTANLR